MSTFKKVALTAMLGFAANSFAASNPIAVVNLTEVFQQVPQGQAAFNTLQSKYSSQAKKLQAEQDALNKEIQGFQAGQTKLNPDQRNAQQAKLIAEQAQVQKQVNDYNANLNQRQQKLLTAFGNNMKTVVTQISQNNNYHLVLSSQTAVYSDNIVDITPQVIAGMKNS